MAKNPVVHFEIGCRDMAAARTFYTSLFDWTIDPMNMIAPEAGGMSGHMTELGHEPHHYTMFYVQVEDVAAAVEKATALGGKVVVPPVTIPQGTFAWIGDPQGNTIGLWKSA